VLDGLVGGQVEALAEVADPAVGGDGDLAVVRGLGSKDQSQQGRLARAVLPDDPGALARPDGEGDVVKKRSFAVRLGNPAKGELGGQDGPPERDADRSSRCRSRGPCLLRSSEVLS